jgi:hypothetical protein
MKERIGKLYLLLAISLGLGVGTLFLKGLSPIMIQRYCSNTALIASQRVEKAKPISVDQSFGFPYLYARCLQDNGLY